VMQTSKPQPPAPTSSRPRLRWWFEIALVLVFYGIYTAVRNQFGSASVSPQRALHNATDVIHIERAVGLFQEQHLQSLFLDWGWFMRWWNIFYGTFHFIVTIFAMVWLYRRHPFRYTRYRNVLAITTSVALIGFTLFPLMPPRLLDDCTSVYGGCSPHGFVDSLSRYGGLWSFDSGTMQSVSNQYAAMPSLHFGWASWCCLALYPVIHNKVARVALVIYPWVTFFAILVTANHYWLDAAGGAFALTTGFVVSGLITRIDNRVHFARLLRHAPPNDRSDAGDLADLTEASEPPVNAP
jgi:hypothetical protein